jgi:hypothetical protein
MKCFNLKSIFVVVAGALLLTTAVSCENGNQEFDDYSYQTVYFSHQTPVRTITLGTDVYSTELDNQHKFQIYATVGGVWKNRSDRHLNIIVDPSLLKGMTFDNGTPIETLPDKYYSMASNQITIPAGQVMGCVDVQLTDEFFADPKSINVNYVLPVRIVSADDSILEGKNYVLYALKYKNKWDGTWISHGTDEIDDNGTKSTVKREAEYLEKNELRQLYTTALKQVRYPITVSVNADNTKKALTCDLILNFDDQDHCTITTSTTNCTASGSGKWTFEGAKKAWGDKDRDQLDLSYIIKFTYTDNGVTKYYQLTSTDQLIMQSRNSAREDFTYKK